ARQRRDGGLSAGRHAPGRPVGPRRVGRTGPLPGGALPQFCRDECGLSEGEPPMAHWSRRQLVQGVGVAGIGLLAGCGRLPWQAQPATRVPTIGWLSAVSQSPSSGLDAFREGMTDLGYLEGQNLRIETRYAEGNEWQLRELASDLAQVPVDVLVAAG